MTTDTDLRKRILELDSATFREIVTILPMSKANEIAEALAEHGLMEYGLILQRYAAELRHPRHLPPTTLQAKVQAGYYAEAKRP